MTLLQKLRGAPALLVVPVALGVGCKTAQLSSGGAKVATSSAAPIDSGWHPSQCKSLGYVVGKGGGTFGGAWVSNESLIEYAMNDLRNKAAELGANFVQHDTPTMGQGGGEGGSTTSTATVSGTVFACEGEIGGAGASGLAMQGPANAAKPATACVPGVTQPCTGPGGCRGGQFCTDDGSRFSACDCGPGTPAGTHVDN